MINLAKMLIFKSGLILIILLMLLGPSTQISVSSETRQHMHSGIQSNETNSNLDSEPHSHPHPHPITNQVGCLKTIGQCFRHSPKELANCAFEHALNNMDCLIVSNTTWHLNEYISFKKNADWTQNEVEARQQRSLFETVLNKISDLIASRSVQFSLPSEEERKKAGLTLPSISGLSDFGGSGRKKKHKGLMGGITMIAMFAQLFLGKIAFLAGASLLLSKIALLFSVVNALKKNNEHSSHKADHIVYADQGHGGYQRSIADSELPTTWENLSPTFGERDVYE